MAKSPACHRDFSDLIAGLESQGLSQAEIAQRAGVSRTTIWRMRNDDCRDHLIATVEKIGKLHRRVVGETKIFHGSRDKPHTAWTC